MDNPSDEEELRKLAYDSILNETAKRKSLAESIGSEAYYINRYSPAKADTDFINRHLRRVNGHNKRWEEEKCWTIRRNLDRLDKEEQERRRHAHKQSYKRAPPEEIQDKYKAEKEFWMVEKALKFGSQEGKDKKEIVEELGIDRSNMMLFPTIASCSSSDESEKHKKKHRHRHRHHHHKE